MNRLTAFLLAKRQLRQRESRVRACVVEAVMERLAPTMGAPAETWATMGLLSQVDVEFVNYNPAMRGEIAAEQARSEGLDAELSSALARWPRWQVGDDSFDRLEPALVLAEWAVGACQACSSPKEINTALQVLLNSMEPQLDGALDALAQPLPQLTELLADAIWDALEDYR